MNVLFLGRWSAEFTGGTESMKTLFEELREDYDCRFLWLSDRNEIDGDEVHVKSYSNFFSQFSPLEVGRFALFLEPELRPDVRGKIREFDPDIIVAQAERAFPAVRYAERNNCKSLVFLRAFELLYTQDKTHKGNTAISQAANSFFRLPNRKISDYCLENADMLVADSNYTASEYRQYLGFSPEVVYEFIDTDSYQVENNGDKILHVNPSKAKGIEITLDVAERLPDEEFIVVGSGAPSEVDKRMQTLENVGYLGYIDDMKEVYRRAKLVLMPSVWEEPFGRIPVEAGISGIPTIGSGKGGLPESIGVEELLVQSNRADDYLEKIKEVERNYDEYSKKVKENAEEMSKDNQIKCFKRLVENLI